MVIPTAFEPFQEVVPGVAHCVHGDFRIGGLKPGESKSFRRAFQDIGCKVLGLLKRQEKVIAEHAWE